MKLWKGHSLRIRICCSQTERLDWNTSMILIQANLPSKADTDTILNRIVKYFLKRMILLTHLMNTSHL